MLLATAAGSTCVAVKILNCLCPEWEICWGWHATQGCAAAQAFLGGRLAEQLAAPQRVSQDVAVVGRFDLHRGTSFHKSVTLLIDWPIYKEATHACTRARQCGPFKGSISQQHLTRLVTPDDAEELKRDVWKAGTTAPVSWSMVLAGMAASSAILKATRRTTARTNRSPTCAVI